MKNCLMLQLFYDVHTCLFIPCVLLKITEKYSLYNSCLSVLLSHEWYKKFSKIAVYDYICDWKHAIKNRHLVDCFFILINMIRVPLHITLVIDMHYKVVSIYFLMTLNL